MFIDGKKYKTVKPFGSAGTTVSSNDNEDIERWMDGDDLADEVEDLTGTDVIALLDIVGRVRHVVGDSEAGAGDQYGVATDAYQTGREYMIRIMGKDGKEVAYPVEKRGDWDPFRKYFENKFDETNEDTPYLPVKYKLSGDGEVKDGELFLVAGDVGPFENWDFANGKATYDGISFTLADDDDLFYGQVYEFDDDDDYIDFVKGHNVGGKRYVEGKTVIMNLALDDGEWDDPEVLEWDKISSKNIPVAKDEEVYAVGYNTPDAKLVVFVQNFDDVVDDEEFGVTAGKPTYDGSDWWIEVDVAGEGKVEYKIDDEFKGFKKGYLLSFTVSSSDKLRPGTFYTRTKTDVQKAVEVFDDGNYLELGPVGADKADKKFKIAKDAVVYDLNKDYDLDKKLDYTDIDMGDKILYVKDDSDIIRAVLIVTKCYKVGEDPVTEDPTEGVIFEGSYELDGNIYVDLGDDVTYPYVGTADISGIKVGSEVKATFATIRGEKVVTKLTVVGTEPVEPEDPEELTAEADVRPILGNNWAIKVFLSDADRIGDVDEVLVNGEAVDFTISGEEVRVVVREVKTIDSVSVVVGGQEIEAEIL